MPGGESQPAALTIYVRNEADSIDIFAFSGTTQMWAATSNTVEGFRDLSTKLYQEIEQLAEEAVAMPRRLTFAKKANALCYLGNGIFSDLFFAQSHPKHQEVLRDLAKRIRELPEGSEVIIATDRSSQEFIVPWGLIYDREKLPESVSGVAEPDGFWGVRFRLSVHPSAVKAWSAEVAGSGNLKTVGKVYEEHRLALRMSAMFRFLERCKRIAAPTDLEIAEKSIPALTNQAFDYLHFFCHGYTELQNQTLVKELTRKLNQSQLMYSPDTPYGSHIKTNHGVATFAKLQEKVPRLAGSPIVQLSMCQSAQVSGSGKSFVIFFLQRGARAVIGTEGAEPMDAGTEYGYADHRPTIARKASCGRRVGGAKEAGQQECFGVDIYCLWRRRLPLGPKLRHQPTKNLTTMAIADQVEDAITASTKLSEDQLLVELGQHLDSIEKDWNSSVRLKAATPPAGPVMDTSKLAGPVADKFAAMAKRFLDRFNQSLYSMICNPDDPDNPKLRVAASEGAEKLGLVLAGVLAAYFAWLPAIIVTVVALVVKRFSRVAYDEACAIWKEQL